VVLSATRGHELPDRSPIDSLLRHLRSKNVLLVLDNCEHLIQACAEFIEALLRACTHLHILATSREPLRAAGEVVWRVPSLTIPAVAVVSIMLQQPITLGLDQKDQVLLALTLFISVITLGTGRTTVLQGVIHLAIFAVFLFFAIVP